MAELFCHCGAGPFADARALGGHRVSHQTVVCEVCGRTVNRKGIGPHRVGHRNENAAALALVEADAHLEAVERTVASLRDLTPPHFGTAVLERAAQLLDKHPEHRGLFIVAGATYGPHLTSRQNVGGIVARAEEPCLVIDLDLLPAPAVERTTATGRWR